MSTLYKSIILLFFSINAFSQTGSIGGVVRNNSGRPISLAHIQLDKTVYGRPTDSLGMFRFTKIPQGKYTVRFSAVGYKPMTLWVEVKANETTEIVLEVEEKIELLNEVEVTGIKTISGLGYLDEDHDGVIFSGKKTEVLLLDSLDANTAQNNPRQVLGRVPGANYSETEGSGFPSNGIGFRGLSPTQSIETNTRQNGYNITADLFGYPESYYLPPLEAVERIEVTRGAASLQFGPQFGGVINYILKKGNVTKPFEFSSQQTTGSFGLFNSFNSVGGQLGKLNYYAFVQYQSANGWRPNSDYRKITGFGRIQYQASKKIKLGVEYSILRNRIHMPGGFTDSLFYLDSRASYRSRNWLTSPWNILAATFDWKISKSTSLGIKSAYNSSGRSLVWRNEDGGPQAMDGIDPITNTYTNREVEHEGFRSITTEVRLLAHYKLGRTNNTIATGGRIFYGTMTRQGGGRGTTKTDLDFSLAAPGFEYDLNFATTNFAPFIENTFRFGEQLSITPGMRMEYIHSTIKGFNTGDGGTALYSDRSKDRYIFLSGMGLQWKTSFATNLYTNWSQAYRPMDYSSLTPLGTIVTVDPNLKDANGYTSDIGFRGSVKNFLNFDVGGFYLQYNNRIGLIEKTDALGKLYPYRTNVANSIHKGLETYIEFSPIKAFFDVRKWNISFFNSLAVIDAKYISGEFNGKFVEYAPTSIHRFGTSVVVEKFSTTFLISSTAKSYSDAGNSQTPSADALAGAIPAYTVMDWSCTFHLRNCNLKFGVNNLADKRYFTLRTSEYPGPGIIPSIGRSLYAGIGIKI